MNEQDYRELMRGRLESYTRRQADRMGPLIESNGLAEGFAKVTPIFAAMGVHIEIVDVSGADVDAAIEILTTCECHATCEDVGTSEPLSVLCELGDEAARRAFPGLTVEVLRQRVRGAHVCVFRYSPL